MRSEVLKMTKQVHWMTSYIQNPKYHNMGMKFMFNGPYHNNNNNINGSAHDRLHLDHMVL